MFFFVSMVIAVMSFFVLYFLSLLVLGKTNHHFESLRSPIIRNGTDNRNIPFTVILDMGLRLAGGHVSDYGSYPVPFLIICDE